MAHTIVGLLVGWSCVCYKLQLDNRTSLGRYGVAPDRSWDRESSYAYYGQPTEPPRISRTPCVPCVAAARSAVGAPSSSRIQPPHLPTHLHRVHDRRSLTCAQLASRTLPRFICGDISQTAAT